MKKLVIAIVVVALLALIAVPTMASIMDGVGGIDESWTQGDPTGEGFNATAAVTLVVDPWAAVKLGQDTLAITLSQGAHEGSAVTAGNLINNCNVVLSAEITQKPIEEGIWTALTASDWLESDGKSKVISPGNWVYDSEIPAGASYLLKVEVSEIGDNINLYPAGTYEGGIVTLTVSIPS